VSVIQAIVLGIVQGLSEFLPISSSGHLEVVPWLFGWDPFNGDSDLQKTFEVALHMGTFVGAAAYFWTDLVRLARGAVAFLRRSGPAQLDGRIAMLLVLSAVPAGITGVLLEDTIEANTDEHWLIGLMLIGFGLVLLWADRLGGRRQGEEFSVRDALGMGVAQALALQPGVSRSGVTITAGRWLGFRREDAARLAFLMSLPIIGGAGAYKALDVLGDGGIPSDFVSAFIWGTVASAVTGWFAVWGTLRLVRTRTFSPFVVYRILLGAGVLVVAVSGLR